jgi:ParB family chromosome partitioning protein
VLKIASENPRNTIDPDHIARLAANISEFGLKQNLVGYADGDQVMITAGGCRLLALQSLKPDRITALFGADGIPVRMETRDDAIASALAENVVRRNMSPAEELRAYKKLHAEGYSSEQIIRAFGLTRRQFDNTMKLAELPDPILAALEAGEMSLDHAAAFAMAPADEALRVFEDLGGEGRKFGATWGTVQPNDIIRALTNEKINAENHVARFVGRKAYEGRGGTVTEDLFSDDVWFDDPRLLNDMALAKLTRTGAKLRREWAWIETVVDVPDYGALRAYGRIYPESMTTLSEAEARRYDELAELANNDAASEAQIAEIAELEGQVNISVWTDSQREIAGAIVTIDWGGKIEVAEGLVRPDDVERAIEAGMMQANRHMPESGKDARDPLDYSVALTDDLRVTMHRTAMQCEMLAKSDKLLEILAANLRGANPEQRLDLTGYPTTRISEALIEQGFTPDQRLVDAWAGKTPKGKGKPGRGKALTAELASRLELNVEYEPAIRDWWTPNATFLKRLTKAQLIEVACEIHAGQLTKWDRRKKTEIVTILATAFDGTLIAANGAVTPELQKAIKAARSWLPPVLRLVEAEMEQAV